MAKKQGTFSSRTKARKRAADVIFEAQQKGLDRDGEQLLDLLAQRQLVSAAQTPLPAYSRQIVRGVAQFGSEIDGQIQKHSKIKALDRLPGVDLAILRVAVWEMIGNRDDVDPIVAIDEAVAIAKSISTDRSPAFVNAVLDAIRRDLLAQGEVPAVPAEVAPAGEATTDELWDELLDEY